MRDPSSSGTRINPAGVGVTWMQVRDAAVGAVRRGWPVVPGVCRRDELGFPELCPLEDSWDLTPITDPEQAHEIWTRLRPAGVLLVCGRGIDALEAPSRVTAVLPTLAQRGLRVPIATALPPSRWLLLVTTGSGRLRPDLAAASVRLHSIGEWAELPPTTLEGYSPLQWATTPPEDRHVCLPDADTVQQVLAEALHAGRPPARRS
ncbi:MAG: bifunctional DNA primase/polymerase [Pseudonocardiales bacterium]|nr:bifunctional DNA primase/polymerase [Pseudonocardiales bacterium]